MTSMMNPVSEYLDEANNNKVLAERESTTSTESSHLASDNYRNGSKCDGIVVFECKHCPFATTNSSEFNVHKCFQTFNECKSIEPNMMNSASIQNDQLVSKEQDSDYEIKQMQHSYLTQSSPSMHRKASDGKRKYVKADISKQYNVLQRKNTSFTAPRSKPGPKPNSGASKSKPVCTPVREAVDPAKYITIQEPDGIKYACSKCGNIYKWRKSLNKHWKEKHEGEVPDPRPNLTALNIPRISKGYVSGVVGRKGNVLPFMASKHSSNNAEPHNELSGRYNCSDTIGNAKSHNTQNGHSYSGTYSNKVNSNVTFRGVPTPTSAPSKNQHRKFDGFNQSINQSVEPTSNYMYMKRNNSMGLAMHTHRQHTYMNDHERLSSDLPQTDDVLDLSTKANFQDSSQNVQMDMLVNENPIDLSLKSQGIIISSIKRDTEQVGFSHTYKGQTVNTRLQCPNCAYSTFDKPEFDKHVELHSCKQQFTCAECSQVFESINDLNNHFINSHITSLHNTSKLSDTLSNETTKLRETTQLYKYLTMDSQHKSSWECIVCGVSYQQKWSLAKHFELYHNSIPNPYKERALTPNDSTLPAVDWQRTIHSVSKKQHPDGMKKHGVINRNCPQDRLDGHLINHCHKESSSYNMTMDEKSDTTKTVHQTIVTNERVYADFPDEEDTVMVMPQAPEDNYSEMFSDYADHEYDHLSRSSVDILPFKCTICDYRARWPSEISQHMKNHSNDKPFLCPSCSYRSKWKWDVVKHLKRCSGGGSINDVVDLTKDKNQTFVYQSKQDILSHRDVLDEKSRFVHCETQSNSQPHLTLREDPNEKHSEGLTDFINRSNSQTADQHDMFVAANPSADALNSSYLVCLHCPFIGNSPAELKRHSRVHSDEKPFICKTCGYCSKWKCDLKKHLRTYNHTSAVPLTYGGHGRKPADYKDTKNQDISDVDSTEDKNDSETTSCENDMSELLACDRSQHVTFREQLMTSHINTYQNATSKSQSKLKCKQCAFESSDLSTFINHKLVHSSSKKTLWRNSKMIHAKQNRLQNNSLTKHRRKASKQNRVIKQMSTTKHDLFPYAESVVDNETALYYENSSDEEQESDSSKPCVYHCVHCSYRSDDLRTYERHIQCHNTNSKYTCEWCTWSNDQISLLYQHAFTVHKDRVHGERKNQHDVPSCTTSKQTLEEKQVEMQSIEESGVHSCNDHRKKIALSKWQDISNIEKRRIEVRCEESGLDDDNQINLGSKRRRRLKTCQKCGYITDNVTTLQRHLSKHGSKGKYTCDYCDYSVDRQHIVEYHVKIVHTTNESSTLDMKLDAVEEEHRPKNSQKNEALDGKDESYKERTMSNATNMTDSLLKVSRNGPKTTYHCQTCKFCTLNINIALNHIKHHGACKRYVCEFCDFSTDHLRYVLHHMIDVHQLKYDGDRVSHMKTPRMSHNKIGLKNYSLKKTNFVANILPSQTTKDGHVRYFCRKCPYFSKKRSSLKRHGIVHNRFSGKVSCKMCPYKATTLFLSKVHIKKCHKC